jgi:tRNA threonylcarbamoyladenosine biosynthesis protein TsaB
MVTLALDTSTAGGSAAVRRDGVLLAERAGPRDVPHARRLPHELVLTLEQAGVALAEVTLFAVSSGPGAFTGLRIGIATQQGLAFAAGKPLVGVSSLEALAHLAHEHADLPDHAMIAAWMDAARGEVFTALYERAPSGTIALVDAPAVASAGATIERWRSVAAGRPLLFIGDGAIRYRAELAAALGDAAAVMSDTPRLAAAIGRLAEGAAARGEAAPPPAIRPLYVRRPDAELARERRQRRPAPSERSSP